MKLKNFFQRQKLSTKKQKGFLSVEVIIVLVIVLGLIALGASKMDVLSGNAEATEEISNSQALYASTKGLKSISGYGPTGTNLVPALISSRGLPKNITVIGTELFNQYGGTISVTSNGTNFTITSTNLPSSACIRLAKENSRSGVFASTRIGSANIIGEVTSAAAASACSDGAAIAWTTTS